jgi:hypothetical protein
MTRAIFTLAGAATSGFLLWLATQVDVNGTWDYWAALALLAAAGLTMALSQLLGGWTKWGWPRISAPVLLYAFVPVLIAAGWVLASLEPGSAWLGSHVRDWTGDIGIRGFVDDLQNVFPVLAFGIGLVFGFSFDTSGPRVLRRRAVEAETAPTPAERSADVDGDGVVEPPAGEPHPLARGGVESRKD